MYSKARILGHPIHAMLVGFPVASYTFTPVFFGAYAFNRDPFWFKVAILTNIIGVVTAVIAAIFGFIDWAMGIPHNHPAKSTGLIHMLANVVALTLFTVNAVMQFSKWNDVRPDLGPALPLTIVGLLITFFAGFMGWKMVQDHHVGVNLSPEQARLEPIISSDDPHSGEQGAGHHGLGRFAVRKH
jgi:uncharacterized membrane protein